MQFIGQKANLDIISKWDKLPNFTIIQGDKHTGKSYLALYLCNLFGLKYVKISNGVDEIRNLINSMTEGANIVYHLKDFDTASVQAKNALLKITEETPAGNYIIVTGNKQIPTLESRARKIVMNSYTKEEMFDFLSKYYMDNIIPKLYMAGLNTPSKVIYYKGYENIEPLLDYAYNIYNHISALSIDVIVYMTHKFESRYEGIDPSVLFLDMLISIINYNTKNNLNYKYSFSNVLNILVDSKEILEKEPTLNRKMFLFQTFYEIYSLGGRL